MDPNDVSYFASFVCVHVRACLCVSVIWGSSPPSCNINGYLVLTGVANVKLLSINGCGPGGTSGAHTIILAMEQPHL